MTLENVERLLDELLNGAEEGVGSSDEVNIGAREAVRLLLDVARDNVANYTPWTHENTEALKAFDASLEVNP